MASTGVPPMTSVRFQSKSRLSILRNRFKTTTKTRHKIKTVKSFKAMFFVLKDHLFVLFFLSPDGVARGKDALTLLDNVAKRNEFLNELIEVKK